MGTKRLWIVGQESVDIARLTGLPLNHLLDRHKAKPAIHADAVRDPDNMYLDLSRLDWSDRWRVAWARIGAHYYIKETASWDSQSSASEAHSSTSSVATSKATTTTNDPRSREAWLLAQYGEHSIHRSGVTGNRLSA